MYSAVQCLETLKHS